MISFGQEICGSLSAGLEPEWLETNGLGGYASSTVLGMNTRRYHGLLVAALEPPGRRFVLLSKLEEAVELGGVRFELSANQYLGAVHPQGFRHLAAFRLDPFPIFTFRLGEVEIEKSVFMIQGENGTVVRYEVRRRGTGGGTMKLQLRPLIAFRDYHCTTHENGALNGHVMQERGSASVQPYTGLPALYFAHNAQMLIPEGYWYRSFQYAKERERGLDWEEDLFEPFCLEFELQASAPATVIASTERHSVEEAEAYRRSENARRKPLPPAAGSAANFAVNLEAAAEQFLVLRGSSSTVIAGYHWFTDWGRDTMVGLPGLTLATGHCNEAKNVLLTFAQHVSRGMLPNRFGDSAGQPEYNTVDAALWFFEAVNAFLRYTADYGFVREHLYSVLGDIVAWHLRGTRYGIKMDDDGLIRAGETGIQLTWMDAKVGEQVITQRSGKPVEVQALWYNALRILQSLAEKFGDHPAGKQFAEIAGRTRASFNRLFWNQAAGYLYDVVDGEMRDASFRPNQIFAVSLSHSMLDRMKAKSVVEKVERELLTPYGLRTLACNDARYRGRYEGGVWERDSAYHQGTVWPWLLGPFLTAYVKVNRSTRKAREQAAKWLQPLAEHLAEAGLGQVSEIFDGDPPHTPRGCIAQAWSVAELLRACREDVLGEQPGLSRAAHITST